MPAFDEVGALFRQIDYRQSWIQWTSGGESKTMRFQGAEASALLLVERLVDQAGKGKALLFKDSCGQRKTVPASLKQAFAEVKVALQASSPRYQYSVSAELFFEVARSLGLMGHQALTDYEMPWIPMDPEQVDSQIDRQWKIYDQLIVALGERVRLAEVQESARRRRDQARMDHRRAMEYLEACLKVRQQLFVLRMDLGCWRPFIETGWPGRGQFDLPGLKRAFGTFTKRLSASAYKPIIGHLAKIEFGPEKGYFFHLVVLLDGSEADRAVNWCRRLGELWESLAPSGEGAHIGCNWDFTEYAKARNLGLVDWGRASDRLNLERWVISYLTLSAQYLRVKVAHRERVFFKGNMPMLPPADMAEQGGPSTTIRSKSSARFPKESSI